MTDSIIKFKVSKDVSEIVQVGYTDGIECPIAHRKMVDKVDKHLPDTYYWLAEVTDLANYGECEISGEQGELYEVSMKKGG